MLRAALLLLAAATLAAQTTIDITSEDLIEQGAASYAKSCAVGYCHGTEGRSARGPALRDKAWNPRDFFRITHEGLPGTSMPAWNGILTNEEIWAITAYIVSLGQRPEETVFTIEPGGEAPRRELTAEEARGKELFFDLTREKRCGLCHALDGLGTAIGPNLAVAAREKSVEELHRAITQPDSSIAYGFELTEVRTKSGERIRGVLAERMEGGVRIYDTSALPAPLRTLMPDQVRSVKAVKKASPMPGGWGEVYSSRDLDAIVAYVRAR
jgi:putative heme-binding domain-containing protein